MLAGHGQIYAYIRENADEKLLAAVNFSGREARYEIAAGSYSTAAVSAAAPRTGEQRPPEDGDILLSSYEGSPAGREQDMRVGQNIRAGQEPAAIGILRPYEAVIVRIF